MHLFLLLKKMNNLYKSYALLFAVGVRIYPIFLYWILHGEIAKVAF